MLPEHFLPSWFFFPVAAALAVPIALFLRGVYRSKWPAWAIFCLAVVAGPFWLFTSYIAFFALINFTPFNELHERQCLSGMRSLQVAGLNITFADFVTKQANGSKYIVRLNTEGASYSTDEWLRTCGEAIVEIDKPPRQAYFFVDEHNMIRPCDEGLEWVGAQSRDR